MNSGTWEHLICCYQHVLVNKDIQCGMISVPVFSPFETELIRKTANILARLCGISNRHCYLSFFIEVSFTTLWNSNRNHKGFYNEASKKVLTSFCRRSAGGNSEYLCKLGKEYLNLLACKYYSFSRENWETFDILHAFLPLNIAKFTTSHLGFHEATLE